jgi:hypothetical protein
MAAIAILAAVAATAEARNIELPTGAEVTVCVEPFQNESIIYMGKTLASRMFARIDVRIVWEAWSRCPDDGIRISWSMNTSPLDHPGALAYAMPYQGTTIVVFWDRFKAQSERPNPFLFAHVLVHEITHVLEGVPRHSETGVLKARFTREDIARMPFESLPFADEDVALIHRGIERRRPRVLARNIGEQESNPVEAR